MKPQDQDHMQLMKKGLKDLILEEGDEASTEDAKALDNAIFDGEVQKDIRGEN